MGKLRQVLGCHINQTNILKNWKYLKSLKDSFKIHKNELIFYEKWPRLRKKFYRFKER